MRLGVYSDLLYFDDGHAITTRRAFIRFVTSLPPRVDEVVLFGRVSPGPGRAPYRVDVDGVRFVRLPYYERVTSVGKLVGGVRGSCRAFARELDAVDAVWIFGPHPLALAFALLARRSAVPTFLGVRQAYPAYIANRLPSRAWSWAVAAAWCLELAFRRLARRAPVVALGEELAEAYSAAEAVLTTGFSLVGHADVVPLETALGRSWEGELRVLSVGRLDPEKNPLLLADVAARLRARDPRWRLVVAGDGPLRAALERRVAELGLGDAVELLGEVPNGRPLWELYGSCHAFLHVSLTEGLPQVLAEAQAAGLPIVATAVGGVPAALRGGATGLLVPPADADAAAGALRRLADDPALRAGLVEAALAQVADETLERQLDRVAAFFAAHRGVAAGARTAPPAPA